MKKSIILGLFFGLVLACMPGAAHAKMLTYDADSTGVVVTYKSLGTPFQAREFILNAPVAGEAQTVAIHMGLFEVDLALTELAPGGRPCFKMKWAIKSIWLQPNKQEGTITLPFGHGGITNLPWQRLEPSQFDTKGVFKVRPFRSSYSVDFGLSNLTQTFEQQSPGRTNNTITELIERDNGNELVDVTLNFYPRLLPLTAINIEFDMKVTPDSATLPDEVFEFKGVMPVRYGNYYFWFYRDK